MSQRPRIPRWLRNGGCVETATGAAKSVSHPAPHFEVTNDGRPMARAARSKPEVRNSPWHKVWLLKKDKCAMSCMQMKNLQETRA